MEKEEPEFLTIDEFSKLLRIHRNSIRSMVYSGRLNAIRIGSGKNASYRIPRSEVQRLAVVDLDKIIDKLVEKKLKEREEK